MRRTALLLAIGIVASAAARADQILYYLDESGKVVFTNTPSRRDARPVPGLQGIKLDLPTNLPDTPYDPFIRKVASDEGLDPSLIKAVALVESGFNPRAVSRKGARGLMQLMPATARQYGVLDIHDPYQNLRGGAQHLKSLLTEFSGDVPLALAAYNAGSGAVRRSGGIPNYRETKDYVRKVTAKLGGQSAPRPKTPAKPEPPPRIQLKRDADGSISLTN